MSDVTPLESRLQDALGANYRIERELIPQRDSARAELAQLLQGR